MMRRKKGQWRWRMGSWEAKPKRAKKKMPLELPNRFGRDLSGKKNVV